MSWRGGESLKHIRLWRAVDNLRRDTFGGVTPTSMIAMIIFIFLIAVLGAAFTPVLQTQVNSWNSSLNNAGQTSAAAVVVLLPLIFWILLAVAVILVAVKALLPETVAGL